jgi:hypothetical protein
VNFGSVLGRKVHMGEHVDLAVVDEAGELRPSCSQLIGDMTQRLGGADAISPIKAPVPPPTMPSRIRFSFVIAPSIRELFSG